MDLALILPLLALVLLLLARMPVAFALATSGFLGLALNLGAAPATGLLGSLTHRQSASLLLTTVPMFILMAEFVARSSILPEFFSLAARILSRARGGLAIAAILANAGFAALSGSSTAAAGAMSRIVVPQMRKHGYDDKLALGTVAASGTLAAMIPPSIALIVYGIQTETSIGKLFIAGILPGVATVIAYIVCVAVWVRLRPDVVETPKAEFATLSVHAQVSGSSGALQTGSAVSGMDEPMQLGVTTDGRRRRVADDVKVALPVLALAVFLLMAIYSGAITPTEAGAVGALAALVIAIAIGGLRGRGVWESARSAAVTTTSILLIVIGAAIFGVFLSSTRITNDIAAYIIASGWQPLTVLLVIVVIYLVLGAFMDQIAILLLTLPFTFPIVTELGFDAIWFGIVVVKTAEIGLMTPPLGLNVFVAAGAIKADIGKAFAGAGRFVLADLVVLAAIIAFPSMTTWLPSIGG